MKLHTRLLALFLGVSTLFSQSAMAHGYPGAYVQNAPGYVAPRAHYEHGHQGGRSWSSVGPALAIGALVGAGVVYATRHAVPTVTYYSAPVPANTGTWYYCASVGAYYPYARVCPEGWQAVPAQVSSTPPPAAYMPAPGW